MPGPASTIARRWFEEVWNQGRAETIDELLAPDVHMHNVSDLGEEEQDVAGFKAFYERFRGAFTDYKFTIHDVVEEGDRVAIRWSATMRHVGDQLGLAPTNRQTSVTGMSFARIKNGRIQEGWNNWDVAGLQRQLTAP